MCFKMTNQIFDSEIYGELYKIGYMGMTGSYDLFNKYCVNLTKDDSGMYLNTYIKDFYNPHRLVKSYKINGVEDIEILKGELI